MIHNNNTISLLVVAGREQSPHLYCCVLVLNHSYFLSLMSYVGFGLVGLRPRCYDPTISDLSKGFSTAQGSDCPCTPRNKGVAVDFVLCKYCRACRNTPTHYYSFLAKRKYMINRPYFAVRLDRKSKRKVQICINQSVERVSTHQGAKNRQKLPNHSTKSVKSSAFVVVACL